MTKILLDVRTHCVETAIKGCYERALSEYFRSKGKSGEAEEKVVLLSMALSKIDFPALRANYRELAGGSEAEVVLTESSPNAPCILINRVSMDMRPFIRSIDDEREGFP